MAQFMSGEELAGILLAHGLKETTTLVHKRMATRVFKTGSSSTKRIEMEFAYIKVYNRVLADQKIVLTPEQVRAMIFFLTALRTDYEAIMPHGEFSFDSTLEAISKARQAIHQSIEFRFSKSSRGKLMRILKYYDSISVDV